MKKYHLLLMLVVILGIYSCQKMFITDFEGETVSMQAVENPALVETIKKHYFKKLKKQIIAGVDEKFSTAMPIRTKSRSNAEDLAPKVYAIWKKARTVKYGQRQILEVPLHSSHRIVSLLKISRDSIGYIPDRLMLKTIFDRLLVSKPSADEDYVAKIIRYHPDRSFLEKHQYDVSHIHLYNLDGFTGYLEYLTVENKRISIVRVVEGRPVKRYYMGAKGPEYNRQKTSNMTIMGYEHCWDECEIEYGEICVGEVDGDPDDPSGDICFEEPIGENCWPVCEYIDDEEGEFCDIPENWGTPECNGGGGEEEPEPEPEPSIILTITPSTDPCLGRASVNERLKLDFVKTNNEILKNKTQHEYGYTTILDIDDKSVTPTSIITQNQSSHIQFTFTKDVADNTLSIATSHNHPGIDGPSLTDVFTMHNWYNNEIPSSMRSTFVQYHSQTIVTDELIFVITIQDLTQWNTKGTAYMQAYNDHHNGVSSTAYNNYIGQIASLMSEFYSTNVDYYTNNPDNLQNFHSMSGIYALMKMLDDAVNIYVSKNDVNNLNFEPYMVDSQNLFKKNPCNN